MKLVYFYLFKFKICDLTILISSLEYGYDSNVKKLNPFHLFFSFGRRIVCSNKHIERKKNCVVERF